MPSIPLRWPSRWAAAACAAVLPVALVACGSEEPEPEASPAPSSPSSAPSSPTSPTSSEAASTTNSADKTTTSDKPEASSREQPTSSQASSSDDEELPRSVEDAYEIFSELVPRSLFEQFDSCESVGMESYFNCSGPEVGQFQFTESKSKAVSTLQTLTELRSSQVVEDEGDRVVGWSSLGSTIIITVVNSSSGQVMQHMISGDSEEPEEKIEELGLTKNSD